MDGLLTHVDVLAPVEGRGLPKDLLAVTADMRTGPCVALLAEKEG